VFITLWASWMVVTSFMQTLLHARLRIMSGA